MSEDSVVTKSKISTVNLARVKLVNFRNFPDSEFEFQDKGVTALIGKNGAGKSTVLDAIHFLCMGKPARDIRLSSALHGAGTTDRAGYFRIDGDFNVNPGLEIPDKMERTLSYFFSKSVEFKENGTPITRSGLIGRPGVVVFSPLELRLVIGQPERRRRFMDRILSQKDSKYFTHLRRYYRTLQERNALLRDSEGRMPNPESLAAVDQTLVEDADIILKFRRDFIQECDKQLGLYMERLGIIKHAKHIKIGLQESASQGMLQALLDSRYSDINFRHTTVGPHRDDIHFRYGGVPAADILSQGEIRILSLAMKCMESEQLSKGSHSAILLFDDLFSELDDTRQDAVSEFLTSYSGQVILTSCHNLPKNILNSASKVTEIDNN